ncbi:hypothetical protein GWI33_010906, partial [Rhynchophorus ferrugineus]
DEDALPIRDEVSPRDYRIGSLILINICFYRSGGDLWPRKLGRPIAEGNTYVREGPVLGRGTYVRSGEGGGGSGGGGRTYPGHLG